MNIMEDAINIHTKEAMADKEFRAGRGDYSLRPKRVRSSIHTNEAQDTDARQEPPIILNGKDLADTRSIVLAHETIWAPKFEQTDRPIAEWPTYQEMKFEGNDRMQTDKLHRRFLPLPRQPANETVMWSQRPVVQSYEWDERYRPLSDEDVAWMHHKVEGEELDEEDARHVLGAELLSAVDPVGVICA